MCVCVCESKCACLLHTACVPCIVVYMILYHILHAYHVLRKLKKLVNFVKQNLELNNAKTPNDLIRKQPNFNFV